MGQIPRKGPIGNSHEVKTGIRKTVSTRGDHTLPCHESHESFASRHKASGAVSLARGMEHQLTVTPEEAAATWRATGFRQGEREGGVRGGRANKKKVGHVSPVVKHGVGGRKTVTGES